MKKIVSLVLVFVLCAGLFCGCGASYEADESTVFILKDGGIVSTDVEDFDEGTYDEDGLESYAKEKVSEYNDTYGKDLVKFKDLSVKDKKATLTLSYASAADYQQFNGIELFTGSIAEALAAGYSFEGEFASIQDGKASPCEADAYLEDSGYKVVVIRGNLNVHVPGEVVCVSVENTGYIDAKTISIKDGISILGGEVSTESTEAVETNTTEVQETAGQVTEGSVSDEDLLNMSTEASAEVSFQFKEENEMNPDNEFSQVYTYIIYK